jgi:hypothetical protein
MIETVVAFFAAHVLADYVFQTKRMVDNKARLGFLLYHGVIVLVTAIALTGSLDPAVFILAAVHLLIDWIKTRLGNGAGLHLADQGAHLVTILMVSFLAPHVWSGGLWAQAPAFVPHVLLLAAGAIYATRAGGFAVGILMSPYGPEFSKGSLPGGGQMIGLLERGLIFVLMLAGLPIGIGFLVAAKSILRFETAKDNAEENRKRSEYIIIGTLASFGWAILVSIAILMLQAQLEPLGIDLPTP